MNKNKFQSVVNIMKETLAYNEDNDLKGIIKELREKLSEKEIAFENLKNEKEFLKQENDGLLKYINEMAQNN